MARKPWVHFTGALYHVMCRGNQRQAIFTDDRDQRRYLDLLDKSQERCGYLEEKMFGESFLGWAVGS